MDSSASREMGFIPMSSISKKADPQAHKCSDWVATEKIHGSSFQIYTDDGVDISAGSRRRNLDDAESFIRCNIKELLKKYKEFSLKAWQIIHDEDRWEPYREPSTEFEDDEEDASDNEGVDVEEDKVDDEEEENDSETNGRADSPNNNETNDDNGDVCDELCRVRIYGELYGGGGINLPDKSAAQKEIIYCDEFRFYVFGLTVNKKWVNIYELNDLCKAAGFPYYAKPACEPKSTVNELKEHLAETGFMRSRSSLTEKEGDDKTNIEGVVMTPTKRPDFRLHAVKFLATAFTDVKEANFGKTKTANFCTKQRYHSVISKLDIDERKDSRMVVTMFIEDIVKESGLKVVCNKLKEKWAKTVIEWLEEDDYNPERSVVEEFTGPKPGKANKKEFIRDEELEAKKRAERRLLKEKQRAMEEENEEPVAMGLFDL